MKRWKIGLRYFRFAGGRWEGRQLGRINERGKGKEEGLEEDKEMLRWLGS